MTDIIQRQRFYLYWKFSSDIEEWKNKLSVSALGISVTNDLNLVFGVEIAFQSSIILKGFHENDDLMMMMMNELSVTIDKR